MQAVNQHLYHVISSAHTGLISIVTLIIISPTSATRCLVYSSSHSYKLKKGFVDFIFVTAHVSDGTSLIVLHYETSEEFTTYCSL